MKIISAPVLIIGFLTPKFSSKKATASGTNGVHVKTGKDGQPKFRFISDEAVFVTANCALGSGKNKYIEYIRLRALAYICVEVMFMILVTGNIDIISNLVIGLIAGVFKILASLKR